MQQETLLMFYKKWWINMNDTLNKLSSELKQYGTVLTDVTFKTLTTLRIGGIAKIVIYPKTILALTQIIREINEVKVPYKVLGKGSNILASDNDFEGVIIKLDRGFTNSYFDDEVCYAEAGCSIIALAMSAMENGLSGLEFASGIPGTVGGVTYMNAGAYRSNICDVIQEVFVLKDDNAVWISNEECNFGYRTSIFHKNTDWIILAVKLKLNQKDKAQIKSLIEERRERRLSTQPLDKPSAGSVFRNPGNSFAWEYIDGIGYRGKSIGGAKVSEKHVNFIVNDGEATANDFIELVNDIQSKVKEKYNVNLEMEVEKFNWID